MLILFKILLFLEFCIGRRLNNNNNNRKQRFSGNYQTLKKYNRDNTAEIPGIANGTLSERVLDDSGATEKKCICKNGNECK